jgi:glycosyltransferase involved in cell wall biosynthesis
MTRLHVDARLLGHSGIGTYLAELLPRVLPALAEWKPRVLAMPQRRAETVALVGAHAEIVLSPVAPLSVRDMFFAPPIAARDVLWTPHFNVPMRARMPLVVTLHDLLPLTAQHLAGRGRSWPVRAWMRAIRARARTVLCVSEFTRNEAVRVGGLVPTRLQVTRLGADEAWLAAGEARAASREPYIVYVGLMKPHKNVARLLRAFARVRDRIAHRLLIVGRHEGIRNVDGEAIELALGMRDRVDLVQDLPFADLVQRVAGAQFAAQPSLHEGFGLPALEAMAAGVPLLAGRAGALPEVCGDAALYCVPLSEDDIARGLLLLATDEPLRRRLSTAGRERARLFSWDACAESTAAAIVSALRLP